MSRPTAEQLSATSPEASVWVAASAGTGKTKVLTDRVLRLLLSGTAPEKILCITFTNAAASEMENRVKETLQSWAKTDPSALPHLLETILSQPPTAEQLQRARMLFYTIIDTPKRLRIDTIHSLCQYILKRFPLETGISPHFKIVSTLEQQQLLQRIQEELYTSSFTQDDIAQTLAVLFSELSEYSLKTIIKEIVSNRPKFVQLFSHSSLDAVKDTIYRALQISPDTTATEIVTRFNRDLPRDWLIAMAEALQRHKGKQNNAVFANLADFLSGDISEAAFDAYASVWIRGDLQPKQLRSILTQKPLNELPPTIEAQIAAHQQAVLRVKDRLLSINVGKVTCSVAELAFHALNYYKQFKIGHAMLDFDDLIEETHKLLSNPEKARWVLYRLDSTIDHLLVDEAQDTSPAQWDIISALAEEFFSSKNSKDEERTLFVVGDIKQSIYSFQGADPEKFETMRRDFLLKAQGFEKNWSEVALDLSFRSTQPVLDIVNRVATDPRCLEAYGGVAPNPHVAFRAQACGRVELWPLFRPVKDSEIVKKLSEQLPVYKDYIHNETPSAQLAAKIADTIAGWLHSQRILPGRTQPIQPSDIMILVKRRDVFISQLIRACRLRGVPISGIDRIILTDHIAVKDMLALGTFLLMPEDDLSLACVLKSPLYGVDEEALFTLAHGRESTLWQALKLQSGSSPVLQRAYAELSELLAQVDFLTPFELFHILLEAKDGRRRYIARMSAEVSDILDEFLSTCRQYEQENIPSMQGFITWLAQSEVEVKRQFERERNEVQIMTVHAAKGLQAPVVFLPDMVRAPSFRDKLVWAPGGHYFLCAPGSEGRNRLYISLLERQQALEKKEELRLLYVAMTRAEDELYMAGYTGTENEIRPDCWYNIVHNALQPVAVKDEETARLVYASATVAEMAEAVLQPTAARPQTPALPTWLHQPVATMRAAAHSAAENTASVRDSAAPEQRLGSFYHTLMELLPARQASEYTALVLAAGVKYHIENAEEKAAPIISLLANPALRPYLEGGLNEVQFSGLTPEGNFFSRRIDKLLIKEDGITIIDYKSDANLPKNDDIPVHYRQQLAEYAALVRQQFPDKPINCAILWLMHGRLQFVPV